MGPKSAKDRYVRHQAGGGPDAAYVGIIAPDESESSSSLHGVEAEPPNWTDRRGIAGESLQQHLDKETSL
jgi:hypothetical protein